MKMKRTFLGCLVALCVSFVAGCGGSGENTVIEGSGVDQAAIDAEDEAYEAEMSAQEDNPEQ